MTCDTVSFAFAEGDDYKAVLNRLNADCSAATNHNMFMLGARDGRVLYECMGYKDSTTCASDGGVALLGGVIGQPCAEGIENIANSNFTGVWTRDDKGQYICRATANDNLPIPCTCKKQEGGSGVVDPGKPEKPEKPNNDLAIGKDCLKKDLPDSNATKGVYVEGGSLKCLAHGGDEVSCRCKITDCKKNYKPDDNGERCVADPVEPVPPVTPIPPKPTEPEYDEIDANNCRLSGGEWKYKSGSKRWECFCGINQSGSDKNMVQTNGFKTCACKKDYTWVDDNDHSKGCKRGISAAENADLNKITNLYGKFEKVVNSMDTKAGQVNRAATAASGASKAEDARRYADQAKGYFADVESLFLDANGLYGEISGLISGLSSELKSKVSTYKKDADTLNSRLNSIMDKARIKASEAERAAVVLEEKVATNDSCKTAQCQKCVDTGGKWEEQVDGTAFCRCDRKQGLVSDSSKMLYCKPAN